MRRAFSTCHCYLNFGRHNLLYQNTNEIIQTRTYAKRKGFRELAKKKKVKTVIEKQAWVPHNLRKKAAEDVVTVKKRSNEHKKLTAVDDVWLSRFYTWRLFDLKEAVQSLRESHHPTMYNSPDAQINLFIELDMTTAKPTRFVDKFHRMAILPHIFEQENLKERSILVFCKTPEQKDEAMIAGANLVGGTEIIREVERGKIVLPDFRFVIAHPSILAEMVTIRGLLRKRFPSAQTGTLGPNIGEMVTQFKNGVEYSCLRDEKEVDYGWINVPIGRLNMDVTKLEENFQALVNDINKNRPRRPGPFITRVLMSSPPSEEKCKINLIPFMTQEDQPDGYSSDEDEAAPVTAKA